MADVWLSVFCCELFVVEPGSKEEAEAKRKSMILVPPEDVERVRDMTLCGRRRWGLARAEKRENDNDRLGREDAGG